VKSILIVDDDEPGLAAVERILEAESFETKSASTPAQALEVLKTWTPSAILLDIQLHGLDNGLEFARRLKANVATSAIPIVAYTAYDDKWTEAEARASGSASSRRRPCRPAPPGWPGCRRSGGSACRRCSIP